MNQKVLEWTLRIAIFGEFLGHGVFAIQSKEEWVRWITDLLGTDVLAATRLLLVIGIMDIMVAFLMLVKPLPVVLAWAVVWGFWTALLRPVVGKPVWDFVERWANWGAPLALLFYYGWPKQWREWFK